MTEKTFILSLLLMGFKEKTRVYNKINLKVFITWNNIVHIHRPNRDKQHNPIKQFNKFDKALRYIVQYETHRPKDKP